MVLSRAQHMTSDTVQLTSHSDSIKFGSRLLGDLNGFSDVCSVRCKLISTICLCEVHVLYCIAVCWKELNLFCFVVMTLPTSLECWLVLAVAEFHAV